ncbi:hypothetical protein DESC_700130 [Desulfosarcina cetonica]|nr:hypothetical protein DESC_700130 [Desulfosarcina cetonica]
MQRCCRARRPSPGCPCSGGARRLSPFYPCRDDGSSVELAELDSQPDTFLVEDAGRSILWLQSPAKFVSFSTIHAAIHVPTVLPLAS